ncbi:uncharacterized protein F4822DRAFT_426295 [Hypoxylon trugodes]|uniref:uncharacterized protein n=1 Tax=Hypoxylon trugodes TaxID=326681 RepID=UPI0021989713|nr:uncharacterized protein F4822DRAFT_426295 [Hypoxylon trugodes]KAI1390448.1 hypothetical protein F4822DRAFT_426295 [Hypoxylon trugodes]
MSPGRWIRKVFRLEGVPSQIQTTSDVAELLSEGFPDLAANDIDVRSLATSLHHWSHPAPQVATLQFRSVPSAIQSIDPQLRGTLWDLSRCCRCEGLTLDCEFLGLTPLNDVKRELHQFDCIAISGLASHPFGSWQPHGDDKTFMWIRDEAPTHVPGMRAILYGQNSSLVDGSSTLVLGDIAKDLIENLAVGGWRQPSAKPIVFIAHSLGGLILKDFFVRIADARNTLNRDIIHKIHGAIMFGVPNLGMDQSHLLAIAEGQPNETLVQDLKPNSNYLLKMDKAFTGTTFLSQVTIFWAYETRLSPTVVSNSEGTGWVSDGPPSLLVDPYSATCRLEHKDPTKTFPIPENHSNMVKFPRNSSASRIVYSKLRDISKSRSQTQTPRQTTVEVKPSGPQKLLTDSGVMEAPREELPRKGPSKKEIIASIDAPDLDLRVSLIENWYKGTFEWIYNNNDFTEWLQSGTGIFWIHGKPGSGKSTLMRFILEDYRTSLFVRGLGEPMTVMAGFFFYYRGTSIQKSLEGLMRSIIRQIIKEEGALPLHTLLYPLFPPTLQPDRWFLPEWTIPTLMEAFRLLLNQNIFRFQVRLFLDALDEFDGPRLLICRFLDSMLTMSARSATRVSICFSSRPEEIFKEYFYHTPGFSLQRYTTKDIRNFCMGTMASSPALSSYATTLVPEIVERASGVFLWVKLVIKDLEHKVLFESNSLEQLRVVVRELPVDLERFYEETIRRIPAECRWETYVLLDLIIRASEIKSWKTSPRLDYLWRAIAVSSCHKYAQARRVLESIPIDEEKGLGKRQSQEILTWGGGLVEIFVDADGLNCVQVMHQTVYEFVTSLGFKDVVLEHLVKNNYANGHMFHSKYLIASQPAFEGDIDQNDIDVSILINHARAAEITSGSTLVEFVSGMSKYDLQSLTRAWAVKQMLLPLNPFSTPLSFAAFSSLLLFLREWVTSKEEDWQRGNNAPLLWLSLVGSREINFGSCDDWEEAITILLKASYNPIAGGPGNGISNYEHGDLDVIFSLLYMLRTHSANDWSRTLGDLLRRIFDLLGPWKEVGSLRIHGQADFTMGWSTPLHLATPAIATEFLSAGADPNCVDSNGFTPLDVCFSMVFKETDWMAWIPVSRRMNNVSGWTKMDITREESYELGCIMAEYGSKPIKVNSRRARQVIDVFEKMNLDTSPFQSITGNPVKSLARRFRRQRER